LLLKLILRLFLFCTASLFAVDAKQSAIELAELNFELVKLFKTEYPSMSVQNLIIEPASAIGSKNLKFERIEIAQVALKQSSGMFSVVFADGLRQSRVFFRYKLTAEVETIKAAKDIQKDAVIESSDIEMSKIPFVGVKDKFAQKNEIVGFVAKRYIKAGGIIGSKDAVKQATIKRGAVVTAMILEGELELEFEAVAMEDALMGQNIGIKGKNGKIYKGVVLSPSRVSIR
jgi:flagella basal body P-ring formation protein FlgA